jgi:putative transcriptional regulator
MKTRMKELRARYDLTQAELSRKVGVRRETIHFVEKGEYNPSLRLALKIARVFEAPVEDIFLFDDEELEVQ